MVKCLLCGKDVNRCRMSSHMKTHVLEDEYLKDPKICSECDGIIPYKKRHNRSFCSRVCSQIFGSKKAVSTRPHHLSEAHKRRISVSMKHRWAEDPNRFGNFGKRNRFGLWFKSKFAGKVYLQSRWELLVANELDSNNIHWCRPEYILWVDESGKVRRYFPDFYLLDYDVYLDPKNDYLMERDGDKIDRAMTQNGVSIYVLGRKHLTWSSIKQIINPN